MPELTYLERVDDAILVAAYRLSKIRGNTLRGGIMDFRQTSVENAGFSVESLDEDIWRLRIDRCDQLLLEPDDAALRQMAIRALEREK